jgi:hypothetical protein
MLEDDLGGRLQDVLDLGLYLAGLLHCLEDPVGLCLGRLVVGHLDRRLDAAENKTRKQSQE